MLPTRIFRRELLKLFPVQRSFTTTPVSFLNQKFRREKGLPLNPNASGVLTDGPDYSFLDGRMTPYGVGQKNRIVKSQETLTQVLNLTKEIDFAVERHNQMLLEEERKRQAILDRKLKPKGKLLIKSSKSNTKSS